MNVDPYKSPCTAVSILSGDTEAQSCRTAAPLLWWVCWSLLLASIVMDIVIVVRRLVLNGIVWFITPSVTLGLIALAQIILAFAMRWIIFQLILHRRRPGELRGTVSLVGVIVIFAMVKLIEYQGFRLWSNSGSIMQFLLFLAPSLVLTVLLMPGRLVEFHMRGRQVQKHWKPGTPHEK